MRCAAFLYTGDDDGKIMATKSDFSFLHGKRISFTISVTMDAVTTVPAPMILVNRNQPPSIGVSGGFFLGLAFGYNHDSK